MPDRDPDPLTERARLRALERLPRDYTEPAPDLLAVIDEEGEGE